MKQSVILGIFIITMISCINQDKHTVLDIVKNNAGEIIDVKITRNKVDSNFVKLTFYSDGELKYLREFKNGKENGKYFWWQKNGNLQVEGFKVNGEYDRVTREVYSNGRTAFEGRRKETEFEGINNSFYDSGALKRRWNRVNSNDLGRSIYYHENGFVKEIGNYTRTKGYVLIGKWNEDGKRMNI